MRYVGFVPVDRKGAEGGKKSIARAASLMRERGYSFLIFPEGTRSLDGRLGPSGGAASSWRSRPGRRSSR